MDEIRLIVNANYDFEFEDGTRVTEDAWHDLPWGTRFSVYEVGKHIDCGPKVYRTYISFENLPGKFEATNFDSGTIYVLSPEGAKELGAKAGNELSNTPFPEQPDMEAVKRLVDELLYSTDYGKSFGFDQRFAHLSPSQRQDYYTPKGFQRLMRQITKRQVTLLVLRWGLDGQPPRLFKHIGPMLVPAIKRSWTRDLNWKTMSELRQVVLREHPEPR